ncbi:HORMA domain superfamily [Sesbania bispinosa]|nr:HORMA domain superfamily [Sesbania bispinosa]
MASCHGATHSETAKVEQIITEFFAKSIHIILESRALSASSHLWRHTNLEPIVVDVVLVQRPLQWDQTQAVSFSPKRVLPRSSSLKERNPFCWNTVDGEELRVEAESEKIVERWVVQYESRKIRDSNSGSRRSSNTSLHNLYKKSTLLLRSLYATVKLLPAYKIFRELSSSGQAMPFGNVSSTCLTSSKSLLRSESAPVSIPTAKVADSPGYSNRHNLPPSSPHRGSRCTSETDKRVNIMQTCTTAEKLFSLGKDESQKLSGVKIAPNSSPQISFSRSSSRSYQDDFDDTDFTCPFDVDDDDMTDPGSRAESFDHGHMAEVLEAGRSFPIRKSQDAAVGALVHMLKKAAPLHQDFSTSEHLSQGTRPETWSNNIQEPNQILEALKPVSIMSCGTTTNRKTTSDALEEFHSYREMKNLLLMRGSNQQI